MNFNIGDKVKAIDEAQEGHVVSINGKNIVVEIDDFEFTFLPQQLIVINESASKLKSEYEQHAPTIHLAESEEGKKKTSMTQQERIIEMGKVSGKRNRNGVLEFDLHIHDLLVNHRGMAPGEMLDYQKEYTVNCIEEALKKGEPSIVFIHGIGKGILKSEILKIFRDYDFPYEDASLREYGLGATEVILR